MKKIVIAFDVDWTLIKTWFNSIVELENISYYKYSNERIEKLLKILSSFKNIKIVVWSWQWKEWARDVVKLLCLSKYVDWYYSKNHIWKDENWKHIFEPDIVPSIAIDDIQDCNLWVLNLIVKEK